MADHLTEVVCPLTDCVFHKTMAERPGRVYCSHGDKPHYMNRNPCPLYRMDWQKKGGDQLVASNAQQFLKLIKKPIR
jgi:hypothetical protein